MRLAVLSVDLVEVFPLAEHVVLQFVALLAGVVESGLLGLVVEVGQQTVEVTVDLLLLVLDLFVFCLALAAGKLCAFFVLEEVDQLPTAFLFYLVLVVTHRPQALL